MQRVFESRLTSRLARYSAALALVAFNATMLPCQAQRNVKVTGTYNWDQVPTLKSLLDKTSRFGLDRIGSEQLKAYRAKPIKLPDPQGKKDEVVEGAEEWEVTGNDNSMESDCSITIKNGKVRLSGAKLTGRGKIILRPARGQQAFLIVEDAADIEVDSIEVHEGAAVLFKGRAKKKVRLGSFMNKGRVVFMDSDIDARGNLDNYGELMMANPDAPRSPRPGFTTINKSTSEDGSITNGIIRGIGVLPGSLTNEGEIWLNDPDFQRALSGVLREGDEQDPGSRHNSQPTGVITVTGDLSTSTGHLQEYINASTHGQMDVYGTVTINGAKITVYTTVSTGFPVTGDAFTVIIADNLAGTNGFTTKVHNSTVYTHTPWPINAANCYNGTAECYKLTK